MGPPHYRIRICEEGVSHLANSHCIRACSTFLTSQGYGQVWDLKSLLNFEAFKCSNKEEEKTDEWPGKSVNLCAFIFVLAFKNSHMLCLSFLTCTRADSTWRCQVVSIGIYNALNLNGKKESTDKSTEVICGPFSTGNTQMLTGHGRLFNPLSASTFD